MREDTMKLVTQLGVIGVTSVICGLMGMIVFIAKWWTVNPPSERQIEIGATCLFIGIAAGVIFVILRKAKTPQDIASSTATADSFWIDETGEPDAMSLALQVGGEASRWSFIDGKWIFKAPRYAFLRIPEGMTLECAWRKINHTSTNQESIVHVITGPSRVDLIQTIGNPVVSTYLDRDPVLTCQSCTTNP